MDTTTPIYNGNSIRQILAKKPKNMIKSHRNEYIRNCIGVYEREQAGIDLIAANVLRNSNFAMINFYLKYESL